MAIALQSVWEFVETYYPNYHHCDEIMHNDDLTKIFNNEDEEGSGARELLEDEFGGDREAASKALDLSNADIYYKAIEGYIKTLI